MADTPEPNAKMEESIAIVETTSSTTTKREAEMQSAMELVGTALDPDEIDYEASAKAVADKVQRQQEGLETALLPDAFHDADYKTVDEIQALLEEQMQSNANKRSLSSNHSSRFGSKGFSSKLSRTKSNSDDGNSGAASTSTPNQKEVADAVGAWFMERAKFIPVRLEMDERKLLRTIENVMRGNEYSDVVDGRAYKTAQKRVRAQLGALSAVLTGLVTAYDYEKGQALVEERDFAKYGGFFSNVFEIGRRYKIMNPEKMRGTYGKLIFMLQDASAPAIREQLDFDVVEPVKTVYSVLKDAGVEELLRSEWIATATMEILPHGKKRPQIQREIKLKENAIELIARQYQNSRINKERIRQCLYSIGDNSSYLNSNCRPVDVMIGYLKQYFSPEGPSEERESLAIYSGADGSRLTHSHERQYHYVLQSLTLWREVVHDMFRLWYLAEEDLLDQNVPYKLRDTGQGQHRLQSACRTSKAMHGILYAVQQRLGHTVEGWVGSSVIHLGDTNVPNAFVFVDKYNQVSRILNPIVQCLEQIDSYVAQDEGLAKYLDAGFGGAEGAKKAILTDFFKGAFDGSGADNFFEAGSCVDGRMSSAWHWCQALHKKPFYRIFHLTNFLGFDGAGFQG